MKKHYVFIAIAAIVAVVFLLNHANIKKNTVSNPKLVEKAKPSLIVSSLQNGDSSRAIPTDPETAPDKKLIAAKKHLPWASEEELKTLIKQGINIENIERGRSPIANDLMQMKLALQQYHSLVGEYPIGNNAEVARALMGENTKKTVFLEWLPKKINSQGEFLDPWNKPYEIKSTKEGKLSIRSAGPDISFGTSDDQIIEP